MSNRVKTTRIQGGAEYAKVADRLKKFREENPRAGVETSPEYQNDGGLIFKAKITKDQADEHSAIATANAFYPAGEAKKPKAFEKLETIAVGRALSFLGYMNNGEIASTEEMEEFEKYKNEKQEIAVSRAIKAIESAKDIQALREAFVTLPIEIRGTESVISAKDAQKEKLAKAEKEQSHEN